MRSRTAVACSVSTFEVPSHRHLWHEVEYVIAGTAELLTAAAAHGVTLGERLPG